MKYSKLIQTVAALIFIVIVIGGVIKGFFSSEDLEIVVTVTDADLPTSIASKYASGMNNFVERLPKHEANQKIKQAMDDVIEVTQFLTQTSSKATYEIVNNSNKTLKNIDIRIMNVSRLTAWGVTGNVLQSVEASTIMRTMKKDPHGRIITFGGIEKIPPRSTLIITIWGEIQQYLIEDPISVTYDGGSGKVIRTSTVKGFASFVYENIGLLLILLGIVNIGAFLFVIDTVCNKMKKERQSEHAMGPN